MFTITDLLNAIYFQCLLPENVTTIQGYLQIVNSPRKASQNVLRMHVNLHMKCLFPSEYQRSPFHTSIFMIILGIDINNLAIKHVVDAFPSTQH